MYKKAPERLFLSALAKCGLALAGTKKTILWELDMALDSTASKVCQTCLIRTKHQMRKNLGSAFKATSLHSKMSTL